MKRSISIFFASMMCFMMPSCQLLHIPFVILNTIGSSVGSIASIPGIPLTDEMPQPELPLEVDSKEEVDITE